jgi:protein-ribulosamine 3-kinase
MTEYHRVSVDGERRFKKVNAPRYADVFAAEADGLQALQAAGVRVPKVFSHGVDADRACLLLEYLDLQGKRDFAALGRMLAALHRKTAPRFGWQRDNYIGVTPQANGWCDDWAEFWRERRLRPQFEQAGLSFEFSEKLLQNHRPQPSLLHGDLWNGNVGFAAQGPVLFDPAVYYGDREADLAMTELFGGFPREFYAAYEEVLALDPGYRLRKHLYNLYHLLNHLNLFGGGYLGQVQATLSLLRHSL